MYDHGHGARLLRKRFAVASNLEMAAMMSTDQEELWRLNGGRAIEAMMLMVQVRKPLVVIMETLKNDTSLKAIARLAMVRRASFELALLGLEGIGAPQRAVNALRRSVDSEVAKLRRQQRQDRLVAQRPQLVVVGEEAATCAAEVLLAWADENKHRFWRRSLAKRQACRNRTRWVGRWDGGRAILGIERDVVDRVLLAAEFAPVAVVDHWHREGWLITDSTGTPRWQTRIGGQGRRRWLLGIRPVAVEEVMTAGQLGDGLGDRIN